MADAWPVTGACGQKRRKRLKTPRGEDSYGGGGSGQTDLGPDPDSTGKWYYGNMVNGNMFKTS